MPTTSNPSARCPQCGRALPAAAVAGGLCPACLLQEGIGSRVDSQLATAPGESGSRKRGPVPLSLDEVQQCFPQLEIVELLGQGGMGVVYKARQPQLDRFVALKILPDEAGRDPAFAERFSREARALARLSHPNIVGVYDFGQAGGHYYLMMEFVDGMTLRQLEQTKKLTPEEALVIAPRICEALQYAHDEGVVHRDIKPGNILVDKKGRVKIADFGLAKMLGQEVADFSLTGDHAVMGTPHYMAPEQMTHSKGVDHRADIYSLGVVVYEMLTGELPVGRFAPPSKKVQIDVRLDEVVLKALESDPALRYQRVSEVKSELDSITGQIEALPPHIRRMLGFEYKSKRTWLGLPLVHIVTRMDPVSGKCRTARGVFAFGAKADGLLAFGGRARGIVACGGLAIGVIPVGGISIGLLPFGGIALGLLLATGGVSLAPLAVGGFTVGLLAFGGGGFSWWPISGPEASPLAGWLKGNFFETALPIFLVVVAQLAWIIPILVMVYFQRKHERGELET
jgi:tRNA A-37 threonylcarbamoyl transferase component Bud32